MGKRGFFIVCTALILAVPFQTVKASSTSSVQEELNCGYYLLHQLADDESNVSMLFLAKSAPESISAYGKQISETGKDTVAAIDEMDAKSPALRLSKDPLPQIEIDVRASIRQDKQHELLFGSSGDEFVRVFLATQIQASIYGLNLCKVLAEKETNPHRAKVLRGLAVKWQKARDDAFRLLRDY